MIGFSFPKSTYLKKILRMRWRREREKEREGDSIAHILLVHLVDTVDEAESVFEILVLLHRRPLRHLHSRPDWQLSERFRRHGAAEFCCGCLCACAPLRMKAKGKGCRVTQIAGIVRVSEFRSSMIMCHIFVSRKRGLRHLPHFHLSHERTTDTAVRYPVA